MSFFDQTGYSRFDVGKAHGATNPARISGVCGATGSVALSSIMAPPQFAAARLP
jgi:hypothetical protein